MPRIVIGLLVLAYCLPAAYATLWADTVRDLSASLAFARGEAIPLVGPPINFGPRAGPAWVWLQAIPLPAFASFTATAIFVALVASLKFPLLYVLGRRASGPALGIAFAAAAAYPCFNIFQWIVFFHPNWVEPTVAAALVLLLIADQRRSIALVYAAAAMVGLAMQMHATSLFYLPLAALALGRMGLRGARLAAHCAGTLALAAAWFAPLMLASAEERGSLAGATSRVATDWQSFDPAMILTVMRSAYVEIPIAIRETYAQGVPPAAWLAGLWVIWAAVAAGAVIRLRSPGLRVPFIAALLALAAGWAIAAAVRSYTSFYLGYFLLPLSAIVMGFALEAALGARARMLRILGQCATALLALSLIVTAYGARGIGRSGYVDSRIVSMGNLAIASEVHVRGPYVTATARDAIARDVCRLPGERITVHGELAQAWALAMGLDGRMHCPDSAQRFLLFGAGPGTHLAALPEAVAVALGVNRGRKERGMRLLDGVTAFHPAQGRRIETTWYHFETLRDAQPMQRVALDVDTAPGESVVVYRHKPYASRWESFAVKKDGGEAAPAFRTFNSWTYSNDGRPARWHVEFETDAPHWTEVFVFAR